MKFALTEPQGYGEKTLGFEWTSDTAKVNNSVERERPRSTKEAVFIEIVIEAKVDAEADFGDRIFYVHSVV